MFEDVRYGQWGLRLWNPSEVVEKTTWFHEARSKDARPGDLAIGEFLGDADLLLMRGTLGAPDSVSLLVATPIDERADWYAVGDSLLEFLERFAAADGDKFWLEDRECAPRRSGGSGGGAGRSAARAPGGAPFPRPSPRARCTTRLARVVAVR